MKENPDMDSSQGHNAGKYIDELLNSFVDGELTVRQQTEVKRLMSNDSRIAKRIRNLQKCRILVGSIPRTKAPDNILAGVTASLVSKALLSEQPSFSEKQGGARYVPARRFLTAVAMISIAAVLSVIVYTIMAPKAPNTRPVTIGSNQDTGNLDGIVADNTNLQPEFYGRLELRTANLLAVNAFIRRAIEDNSFTNSITQLPGQEKSIYNLTCSREELDKLLFGLEGVWAEFDSSKFFVDTETFGRPVIVEAVTTKQVAEIVNQESADKTVAVAKDYAVFNGLAENMPGREVMTAINDKSLTSTSLRIPQPVLTGGERKPTKKTKERTDEKQTVHLTIIVDR